MTAGVSYFGKSFSSLVLLFFAVEGSGVGISTPMDCDSFSFSCVDALLSFCAPSLRFCGADRPSENG